MTWSQEAGDNSTQIQVGGTQPTDRARDKIDGAIRGNFLTMMMKLDTIFFATNVVAYFSGRWSTGQVGMWVFLASAVFLYTAIMISLYRLRKRLSTSAVLDPGASSRMPGNENTS